MWYHHFFHSCKQILLKILVIVLLSRYSWKPFCGSFCNGCLLFTTVSLLILFLATFPSVFIQTCWRKLRQAHRSISLWNIKSRSVATLLWHTFTFACLILVGQDSSPLHRRLWSRGCHRGLAGERG